MGRFLDRTKARLSAGSEDAELRKDSENAACDLIATRTDREIVTLHGSLRTVTLRPHSGVCSLEAELYDGSGKVIIIWLGRRRIVGIEPGRQITVQGRLADRAGERILFNPRYELTA